MEDLTLRRHPSPLDVAKLLGAAILHGLLILSVAGCALCNLATAFAPTGWAFMWLQWGARLFMGGQVSGGLYGRQPSLTDLEGGDLKHAVDFRALYATVAERWWGLPADGSPFAGHRPVPLVAV